MDNTEMLEQSIKMNMSSMKAQIEEHEAKKIVLQTRIGTIYDEIQRLRDTMEIYYKLKKPEGGPMIVHGDYPRTEVKP